MYLYSQVYVNSGQCGKQLPFSNSRPALFSCYLRGSSLLQVIHRRSAGKALGQSMYDLMISGPPTSDLACNVHWK